MSLHKRLSEVHMSLMAMNIQKSGRNNHKGFDYYELEDILPPILTECHKKEMSLEFTYCEGVAILKLVDWNDPKQYIPFRIEMPEMVVEERNPNNKLIQTLGANITYLQRYLLKLAFPCLTDKDIVDSDSKESTASSGTSEPKNDDMNVGLLIVEAENKLKKKGLTNEEITPKAIKMEVRRLKKWSPSQMRTINNYFQKEGF